MAQNDRLVADFEYLVSAIEDGYIFLEAGERNGYAQEVLRASQSRLGMVAGPHQFWLFLSSYWPWSQTWLPNGCRQV